MTREATRTIALGGILAALSAVFLMAIALAPTADLTLLGLSSLPVAIAVIEIGYRRAMLVYLVASLISLTFPGLAISYPFLFFFGLFPIIKGGAEQRTPRPVAALIKQVAGNLLIVPAVWLFAREVIAAQVETWGWWIIPALVVALQLVLLVYDYALSLLITFYLDRLARQIRR